MDEPLHAHTPNEVEYYLRVTSCAKCGGPMETKDVRPEGDGDESADPPGAKLRARCKRCGARATFHFRWDHDTPVPAGCVNPTDRPSAIIDLEQWVALYYLFHEEALSARSPAEARRADRQAALCLAEALKFHGGQEFPPESAFFREASLAAFRRDPANYAHTRLRELQALLPRPVRRAEPASEDETHPAWWKFWQRG